MISNGEPQHANQMGGEHMYEYKVLVLYVRECEETLNRFAKEGWRLAAMVPDQARGVGVVATLERKIEKE